MKWLCVLFLALSFSLYARTIEFYADWSWNSKGTKLFTPKPNSNEEEWSALSKIGAALRESDWEIKCWDYDLYQPLLTASSPAISIPKDTLWVFWNMGGRLKDFDLSKAPKEKLILFMWEPPTVQSSLYTAKVQNLFGKIFTWNDDLVDNRKFFKFNYPVLKKRTACIPDFDQKKFCVMINTYFKDKHPLSLYGQRVIDARFFEEREETFDIYGRFWDQTGLTHWKGKAKDKEAVLKNYKFCLCYENMRDVKGYITEKIFDCFAAGCVPIYWGASNVADYIPPECFIDRRAFASLKALHAFLRAMSRREYERYLEATALYLESEEAQVFSRDAFVKVFMNGIVH